MAGTTLPDSEPLSTCSDNLSIRQLVTLLYCRAVLRSLQFLLEVQRNVCKLLLHITNNFPF
ncbi:UNVERIFIED_CONTAM: hypothetical protein Sradi_2405000 [Sesamum radiatum]|uniref:Uncharacterized protein n=1 Tax=Sesamum radiatum TaxID=300843 RepID=A0AAW2SIA3_SESRA